MKRKKRTARGLDAEISMGVKDVATRKRRTADEMDQIMTIRGPRKRRRGK